MLVINIVLSYSAFDIIRRLSLINLRF